MGPEPNMYALTCRDGLGPPAFLLRDQVRNILLLLLLLQGVRRFTRKSARDCAFLRVTPPPFTIAALFKIRTKIVQV